MPTIVTMPKWGLTMTSGTITGWSREEGDPVTEGVPLLTVETEKAVDDVEAPASGVLRKIVAAVGSEVPVMGASRSSPRPAKISATKTCRPWSPRRAEVPQ